MESLPTIVPTDTADDQTMLETADDGGDGVYYECKEHGFVVVGAPASDGSYDYIDEQIDEHERQHADEARARGAQPAIALDGDSVVIGTLPPHTEASSDEPGSWAALAGESVLLPRDLLDGLRELVDGLRDGKLGWVCAHSADELSAGCGPAGVVDRVVVGHDESSRSGKVSDDRLTFPPFCNHRRPNDHRVITAAPARDLHRKIVASDLAGLAEHALEHEADLRPGTREWEVLRTAADAAQALAELLPAADAHGIECRDLAAVGEHALSVLGRTIEAVTEEPSIDTKGWVLRFLSDGPQSTDELVHTFAAGGDDTDLRVGVQAALTELFTDGLIRRQSSDFRWVVAE